MTAIIIIVLLFVCYSVISNISTMHLSL